ncbi:MAG: cytochrome c biogenesis protein CcsA [Candidatus Marinimicrobia bacterium]|nr:cytochrome c biogenesis protein CcsA [Candidatus Neomarinimicrobiota bacterium]
MSVESILLIITTVAYIISCILHFVKESEKSSRSFFIIGLSLHLIALIVRSILAQHPPFSNLYETMILLPFLIGIRYVFWKKQIPKDIRWIMIILVIALLVIAALLPNEMKKPEPLMPALNSIWMYIHVPAYFFGYVSIFIALVYAVFLLARKNVLSPEKIDDLITKMDREVKICFFFLNIGLITGAIWAYISWGNYWSWDPKETWALINILILTFYFHLSHPNLVKKAIVIIVTFLSVLFTYWGVSYLLIGLHSYT